jgi:hypothetical protein
MGSFEIDCPTCNKKVTATTLRAGTDLTSALTANVPIKVMHLTEGQGNLMERRGSRRAIKGGSTPWPQRSPSFSSHHFPKVHTCVSSVKLPWAKMA